MTGSTYCGPDAMSHTRASGAATARTEPAIPAAAVSIVTKVRREIRAPVSAIPVIASRSAGPVELMLQRSAVGGLPARARPVDASK